MPYLTVTETVELFGPLICQSTLLKSGTIKSSAWIVRPKLAS